MSIGPQLKQAFRVARMLRKSRSSDPRVQYDAGWGLLDQLRRYVLPEYRLTDYAKRWFEDQSFFEHYHRFSPNGTYTADRKFFLRELVRLVSHLDGDTAEAGVHTGASSWFICHERGVGRSTHWGFDSFEGLSAPISGDGTFWRPGDLSIGPEMASEALCGFDANLLQGWIPEVFQRASIDRLVFAHIDVDLYGPTLDSMRYFYPLLVSGGILVCDDYGFTTTPGATGAMDEYMLGRPEPIVHCPTGQGFIIKR